MTMKTPAQLGFRMPAEWHEHAATWLAYPKDPVTFPERVAQVEEIYFQMIAALAPHERVNLLVDDAETERRVRARFDFAGAENVTIYQIETVDVWMRDYGPNFLINESGELAFNDWIFNAWGDKYASLKHDDAIPSTLENILRVPRFEPHMVLEGGAIDTNGAGCLLTTEQCLLNKNRNPDLPREEIEHRLREFLGVEKILWLGTGIVGDDTDGHIDDIARFVSENTIVCALEDDSQDENYKTLRENYERLKEMTDARGRGFNIVTLPMPEPIWVEDDTDTTRAARLPASYVNFYIANNVVLAPVFGQRRDARAVEILQRVFPTRRIVPINCEPLVWGMGTIHCVTQQQPKAGRKQEGGRRK
jgi:agmatine deiminase